MASSYLQNIKEDAPFTPADIKECSTDKFKAIERFLAVRNKEGQYVDFIVPFALRRHFKRKAKTALFLKPRQAFLTSTCDAWNYMDVIEGSGINVLALNLDSDRGAENFKRVLDFNEHRHPMWKMVLGKAETANSEELIYRNKGSFKTMTIKNDSSASQADLLARSITARRVRWTEAAFSRHYDIVKNAIVDTIPFDGELMIETTGNGAQGGFYKDFMSIVRHGKQVEPNIWIHGDQSAHFEAWFEHDEYWLLDGTVDLSELDPQDRLLLEQHESEHIEAMENFGLTDAASIQMRLNWRRWQLWNRKGILKNAARALNNMNREYPGTYLMAFQSTGSAWLNLPLVLRERDRVKAENSEKRLPELVDMRRTRGEDPVLINGRDIMLWNTVERGYKNRYLVSADIAAGLEGGDGAAIIVLDRLRMKWPAVVHGAFSPFETAEFMIKLGLHYDMALLSWENNSLGLSVTEKLRDEMYPNLYKSIPNGKGLDAFGWNTNIKTRGHMVGLLKSYFERPDSPLRPDYLGFHDEAVNFIDSDNNGKPKAILGEHDDIMMAAAQSCAVEALMPPVTQLSKRIDLRPAKNQLYIKRHAKATDLGRNLRNF